MKLLNVLAIIPFMLVTIRLLLPFKVMFKVSDDNSIDLIASSFYISIIAAGVGGYFL
jgi:hypothetical protein